MQKTRQLVGAIRPLTDRVWRGHCWRRTANGPRRIDEKLNDFKIAQHVAGREAYGACPIKPGENTTRLALFDLDNHDARLGWAQMVDAAQRVINAALSQNLVPIPFKSSGGNGIHIFFMWEEPQDAYSVRQLLTAVLTAAQFAPGTAGVADNEIELFPKQNEVPADGFGSMFVLPLAGKSEPLSVMTLEPIARDSIVWPCSQPVPVIERPVVEPAAAVDAPELAQLKAALDAIPNNEAESLDYDEWRNIIFAIHAATDGSDAGLALAHAFSSRSAKYDGDFLDNRVWPYIRGDRDNGITARTIFAKAREHGYEEPVEDDFEVLPSDDLKPANDVSTLQLQSPEVTAAVGSRFRLYNEDELLAIPRPKWWLKGVVPMAELVVVYGASGSGKTFWTMDVFAAIGQGIEWRGLKTRQGRVVYVAAEGQGGFRNRVEAYRQHHGRKTGMRVILDAPNLLKADAKPLAQQIVANGGADIIVIDTLAQVSPGGDENSAEDMGRVLWNCKMIHRATKATIVLIHHAGKDLSKGARGWSGLKAAADAEIEVNRFEQSRWAKVTKSKDGEDGAEYHFRLAPVVVGEDDDGDEITSCVVEHIEEQAVQGRREPSGTKQRLVWRLANEMAELGDGVAIEVLITEAIRRMPENRDDRGRDRRREKVRQALEGLAETGFVFIRDGVVYAEGEPLG